jgi:hypothetical protein
MKYSINARVRDSGALSDYHPLDRHTAKRSAYCSRICSLPSRSSHDTIVRNASRNTGDEHRMSQIAPCLAAIGIFYLDLDVEFLIREKRK